MKVLVTGATGFVGSHLCEELAKQGHQVFAQARNPKKFQQFKIPGKLIEGELNPHKACRWIEQLPEDLDAIIHTVGIVHSFSARDFFTHNTESFKNFLEELRIKYPQKKLKIIFISSLAAAGPSDPDRPLTESDPAHPINNYGKSKREAEIILDTICPNNWSTTIIRPPMIIGPRDPAILDVFKMVKSKIILYPGLDGLENRYSFISVFDLIKICTLCLSTKKSKELFFVGHNQAITYRDIITEIATLLGFNRIWQIPIPRWLMRPIAALIFLLNRLFKINTRLTPDKAHEIIEKAWTCCSRHSIDTLKYQYEGEFKQTLSQTFNDYKKRQWI